MPADQNINPDSPALKLLQQALDQGEIAQVRTILSQLDDADRATLRLELGEHSYQQVVRCMQRARSGRSRGNVIVLHGIMGGRLAVRRQRDTDNVWINYWRLAKGRIADLELNAAGEPADPAVQVIVNGQLKKYYLPMVLKLDQNWKVKPFAYDWRKDMSHSAEQLAQAVRSFPEDEPVHLVAHSMGGLVSRYMIHLFPELWKQMADSQNLARGGRLIMLGTPNHGSYAIPVAMTGEDKQLKLLAKLDLNHGLADLVEITNTFGGSYQMLPSPLVDLDDDHDKLFKVSRWGDLPVHKHLLERAAEFHDEIAPVIDRERFIYVAGYNRETPHRVHIESPGQFRYQLTGDGDGRVPHELGLLDGVPTWWADAAHGDLARSDDVLEAIDGLLEHGRTTALLAQKPVARSMVDKTLKSADEFQQVDPEVEALVLRDTRARRAQGSALTEAEKIRVENELARGFIGAADVRAKPARRTTTRRAPRAERPALRVEVVWGDITRCEGDVFTVGHYQGVLPQFAELALDAAISNDEQREHPERHVLRQHTLRGTLRGALGDVDFFPWKQDTGKPRVAAVAGMGHIGSFTASSLRTLARTLVWAVSGLQQIDTVCTVLIGSGEGSLTIEDALGGLVQGIGDALSGEIDNASSRIKTVRIVELFRDRAERIHDYLQNNEERFSDYLNLDIADSITRGRNACVRPEDALLLVLDAVMRAAGRPEGSRQHEQLSELIKDARVKGVRTSELRKAIEEAAAQRDAAEDSSSHFYVSSKPAKGKEGVPFRLSYLTDGSDIRAAAISDTATVSERVLRFDRKLVDEVSNEVMDVDVPLRPTTPEFLRNLVVPQEFQALLDRGNAFVFEVDRQMAQVPWEILAAGDERSGSEPLAIRAMVARQLRTAYSGRPGVADHRGKTLRALVIGDPGDPALGENLPGAQAEALAVHALLESKGVEVDLLVGSLDTERTGSLRKFPAATRVRVMEKLMLQRYDILHYCGHGDFGPDQTARAGWLFADGLLTAFELERISRIPAFVVANACLSGRTSQRMAGGAATHAARDDLALLPSLADEFFRRGVINYIGTAWEVSDEGAVLFAQKLYDELLPTGGASKRAHVHRNTVGHAVKQARELLYNKSEYGKLWAAYQHYGDPTSPL